MLLKWNWIVNWQVVAEISPKCLPKSWCLQPPTLNLLWRWEGLLSFIFLVVIKLHETNFSSTQGQQVTPRECQQLQRVEHNQRFNIFDVTSSRSGHWLTFLFVNIFYVNPSSYSHVSGSKPYWFFGLFGARQGASTLLQDFKRYKAGHQ